MSSVAPTRYRIAELSRVTGTSRETIHFYVRRGLLPRPLKGGRTVAFYGEVHVERLRLIRQLREEKYLPLAVIGRLLDGAGGGERDTSVLADILRIDPHVADGAPRSAPSPAARTEARARGLVPAREGPEPATDAAELRVLALVDEALALPPVARSLTLADLGYCAESMSRLVTREASLFFDRVLVSGDVPGALGALRAGRGAVARFITAYRDLLLHRLVEDLGAGLASSRTRASDTVDLPLSEATIARLGGRPSGASPCAPFAAYVLGEVEALAKLPDEGPPPVRALILHARCSQGEESAVHALAEVAVGSALGQVLLGEVLLARALFRPVDEASLIEPAVAALGHVVSARPEEETDADAQALAFYRAGRVELALPAVLGRREHGISRLERALAAAERASPLVRAHVLANGNRALATALDAAGQMSQGSEALARPHGVDPDGPIGQAAFPGGTPRE